MLQQRSLQSARRHCRRGPVVCLPWHDASSILPNCVKLRFKLSAFIICLLSWPCKPSGPVQLSAVTSLPRARVKRKTRDGPGLRHHGAHGGCALNAAFRFGFYSVTTQLSCSKFAVSGSLSEGHGSRQLHYFDALPMSGSPHDSTSQAAAAGYLPYPDLT